MMFALWIAVTFFRPCLARVLEREVRDPRRRALGDDLQALDDAGHHFVLEPRIEILGVLAHDDQVDALEPRVDAGQVPDRPQVRVQIQRLAQADVDAREPLPIGVVTGPFSATLLRRIESISSTGSAWPVRSKATTPAACGSQSIDTPDAFRMRTTASVTSGPMPSPGISVMVCVIRARTRKAGRGRGRC